MIKEFADWVTYNLFSINPETLLAQAVNFFIYDIIKIFLLLIIIIFVVSIIRSFLPPEKIKNILSGRGKYTGNFLASLIGIVTPFCTCSAIPLFLGFVEAGVPLGVTFSFLVASPMINEIALVMLFGLFGWKVALIYIASGMVIAIVSGIIIGKLKLENLVYDFSKNKNIDQLGLPSLSWKQRIFYAKSYTFDIVKKIWVFIILGVGVGAWVHGYVPADLITKYAQGNNWYSVPLVVLIGIPLYSNAAGIIPLVSVLTEKGLSMGTTLAFMMAVTGLSLPEFLILKKVMKLRLIIIFAGIVGVGIIFTGYLFNFLL
jgi:hypothetical protein